MKSGARTRRLGRAALVMSTALLGASAVSGIAQAATATPSDANAAVSFDPATANFGAVKVGTAKPIVITVSSVGTGPVTFGTAALSGTGAAAFALSADTCSTATVDAGATCTITATITPTAPGPVAASLDLPDSTDAGTHSVPLSAIGVYETAGTYYAVTPARLLDTRIGLGAPQAPLGAGGVLHLQVAGQGGVPATGVSAVVLNVTVTGPTASSFLSVYPTGGTRPTVSSLNFPKGFTGANNVTVPLGDGGQVDLYNLTGTTQVIADVLGFYAADDSAVASLGLGGLMLPGTPQRVEDTRTNGKTLHGGQTLFLSTGDNGAAGLGAFAINLTAVNPTASGFLTTWNGVGPRPTASTLNFTPHSVVSNFAIVPVGLCDLCAGSHGFAIYNSAGNTDVVVDVVGIYDDGTLGFGTIFQPLAPKRIADSRIHQGLANALGAHATGIVAADATVVGPMTLALAGNVTAVTPTASTFLTVWPSDEDMPLASTVNVAKGKIVPNAAIISLAVDGSFSVFNNSGTTNVLVDVAGTFELVDDIGIFSSAHAAAAAKPTMPKLGAFHSVVG
jgi:hypothetical protein